MINCVTDVSSPFPPQFWQLRLLPEHKIKPQHHFKGPKTVQVQSKMNTLTIFPNVETSTSFTLLFCRSDSPQPTPTTLLPLSDAPTDNVVPTATANRVREIQTFNFLDHLKALTSAHQYYGKHQNTTLWNKWASCELSAYSFTLSISTKSHQLDITCKSIFLVPLADSSNDREQS